MFVTMGELLVHRGTGVMHLLKKGRDMWETFLTVVLMIPGTLLSVWCIVDRLKARRNKHVK